MSSTLFADCVGDEASPLLGFTSRTTSACVRETTSTFPTSTIQMPKEVDKPSSLPKVQLGLLCLLRALDPMCFTQILPYINQFLLRIGVTGDPARVGIYSGLVESTFALFQLISIYPWGRASDIFGRRPVVLVGVFGLSIATFSFGLSKSFTEVIIARAIAGIFSGNVSVIPSMLCDITNPSTQNFAFSFFGLWWPAGAIIGPLIGGSFSNVSTKYPTYFQFAIIRDNPYFFPGFLISLASISVLSLCYFYLDETLSKKRLGASVATPHYDRCELDPANFSIRDLLSFPVIRALCISACVLSFISTAFDVIFVLVCYLPIDKGGLGFDTSEIGIVLAMSGLLAAAVQVFALPTALQYMHQADLYHRCISVWPFSFLLLPCLAFMASHVPDTRVLWICMLLNLLLVRFGYLAYSINMLLVKRYAPNSAALGSVNGLIQIFICFARFISPAFASTIFAFSTMATPLGRHAWVLIMTGLSCAGLACSRNVMICSLKEDQLMVIEGCSQHNDG